MTNFDDIKTKEFEILLLKQDILGLESFIEKNLEYKKIYDLFKGRFYFDKKDIYHFKISPDNKTAALISQLFQKYSTPFPSSTPKYNLEILIARYGTDQKFHKAELLHYDAEDQIRFVDLENNAILLTKEDNPQKIIRRFFKSYPGEEIIPKLELLDKEEINRKKQKLAAIRDEYRKQSTTTYKMPLVRTFARL